jgi:hypothetical protein
MYSRLSSLLTDHQCTADCPVCSQTTDVQQTVQSAHTPPTYSRLSSLLTARRCRADCPVCSQPADVQQTVQSAHSPPM